MLIIMVVWIIIWCFFYFLGARTQKIPSNPQIKKYSTVMVAVMFIFYTILFNTPPSEAIPAHTRYAIASVFLFVGTVLMITARLQMKHLTYSEVVLALNPTYSHNGIYKFMKHPMYIGIFSILTASYVLIPNMYTIPLLLIIYICIRLKMSVENAEVAN